MPIQDTVQAIRSADLERRRRAALRRHLRQPIERVDMMLRELEEIHLRGGVKVPQGMIPRIEAMLADLPAECVSPFPLRTTIVRVMDNLYAVQDCLLSRKDRQRGILKQVDEALERGSPAA